MLLSIIFISIIVIIIILYYTITKKPTEQKELNFVLNKNKTPYCIVFDVETTGLIKDSSIRPSSKSLKENNSNFPKIVSISWGLFSRDQFLISEGDYLIKQEDEIPKESTKIHGITTEMCNTNGHTLKEILHLFADDANKATAIVAHNLKFDKNVTHFEYLRNGMKHPFSNKTNYDTMIMGRDYISNGKLPSLRELCIHIFGSGIESQLNSHNSTFDTFFTAKCFFYLKSLKNYHWSK